MHEEGETVVTETLFLRHRLIAQLYRLYKGIVGVSTIKVEMQSFADMVKADIVQRTGADVQVGAIVATNHGIVVISSVIHTAGDLNITAPHDMLGAAVVNRVLGTCGEMLTYLYTTPVATLGKADKVEHTGGYMEDVVQTAESALAVVWEATPIAVMGMLEVETPTLQGVMEFAERYPREGLVVLRVDLEGEPSLTEGAGMDGFMVLTDETEGTGSMAISHKYKTETESGGTAYYITSNYHKTSGNTVYIGGKYGG